MWSQIVYGFLKALLEYFDKTRKEPKTLQDVKTPKQMLDDWHTYLSAKLRDKNSGN